MFFLCNKLF